MTIIRGIVKSYIVNTQFQSLLAMIFILVILYFVEAFEPSVDVQNSLAERSANILRIEDYNSNMKIRLKRQAGSVGVHIKSKLQRRCEKSKLSNEKTDGSKICFKVAKNSRGKIIKCENDQQSQLS